MTEPTAPPPAGTEPEPLPPAGTEPGPPPPAGTEPEPLRPGVRPMQIVAHLARPFGIAFTATVAVLIAIALGAALASLSTVTMSVGLALFVALALNPLVLRMERRGIRRGRAIAIVFSVVIAVVGSILVFGLPSAIGQVVAFVQAVPGYLEDLKQSDWYQTLMASEYSVVVTSIIDQINAWLSDPANLLWLGSGAVAVGVGVINTISTTVIVIVLALYFIASLDGMKAAFYRLVPAYSRPKLAEITEQITSSIGAFVAGGVTLSSFNAMFSVVLLGLLGVPYALMLGFASWLITLIPMIGSVVFWILATLVTLLHSPPAALAFAVIYFIYMQFEAYWLTPRIMSKASAVPGALVLIGAMIGGTLLGLLGALIAVPVTASILLILRSVYIRRQDARTSPDTYVGPIMPEPEGTT